VEPRRPGSLGRRALEGWTAIATRFGAVQTLVILGLFYFLLIGPLALVSALGQRDYLSKNRLARGVTGWWTADSAEPDLERARLTS